ncbi:DUF4240 domain-containing protein [Oerskovia sp. KBS0722]|uniref:DUF4240 domain-containing protein n=1 Tax=Oerskovia sp. KBS0722 TaxID=1179673 RepID=UPI00352B0D53
MADRRRRAYPGRTRSRCPGRRGRPLPDALTAVLVERLTPDEILAFAAVADEVRASAYAWVVWGAALLIEGGCSDDGGRRRDRNGR